jgi:NifU-like protein involved in Fe-S cluster formation
MSSPLYSLEILRLAASSANFTRLVDPDASVEKRSQICGSHLVVDITLGADGRVEALGMDVRACAFGQAASAVMAAHAIGRSVAELEEGRAALANYLSGTRADAGDWPGLDVFAPVREKTARHPAIMLAFEAAAEAARKAAL